MTVSLKQLCFTPSSLGRSSLFDRSEFGRETGELCKRAVCVQVVGSGDMLRCPQPRVGSLRETVGLFPALEVCTNHLILTLLIWIRPRLYHPRGLSFTPSPMSHEVKTLSNCHEASLLFSSISEILCNNSFAFPNLRSYTNDTEKVSMIPSWGWLSRDRSRGRAFHDTRMYPGGLTFNNKYNKSNAQSHIYFKKEKEKSCNSTRSKLSVSALDFNHLLPQGKG